MRINPLDGVIENDGPGRFRVHWIPLLIRLGLLFLAIPLWILFTNDDIRGTVSQIGKKVTWSQHPDSAPSCDTSRSPEEPRLLCLYQLHQPANPLLDGIEFWRMAEFLVALLFRVHPRPDLSLNIPNVSRFSPQNRSRSIFPRHEPV